MASTTFSPLQLKPAKIQNSSHLAPLSDPDVPAPGLHFFFLEILQVPHVGGGKGLLAPSLYAEYNREF